MNAEAQTNSFERTFPRLGELGTVADLEKLLKA
jgi:hypothetical protein